MTFEFICLLAAYFAVSVCPFRHLFECYWRWRYKRLCTLAAKTQRFADLGIRHSVSFHLACGFAIGGGFAAKKAWLGTTCAHS